MIIFDLVLATRRPQMTGVERYGVRLFVEMRRRLPDVHAFVSDASALSDRKNVHIVRNALAGWLTLPIAANRLGGETPIIICPSFPASPLFRFTKHRICRIIHDAFPWARNGTIPLQGRIMFRHIENMMLARNTYVCAPTEQVTRELHEALHTKSIQCCGNAPGLDLENTIEEPVESLVGRRYALAVGTVEPRKNYEKIVGLAGACVDSELVFVVAGRPGWGPSAAMLEHAAAKAANILWLRDASDGELLWLYRNSTAFLSASHAEGFNMPLVEAGMCGCRIICSDIPIHRDVAPQWAVFFPLWMADPEVATLMLSAPSPASSAKMEAYRQRYGWNQVADRIEGIIHA